MDYSQYKTLHFRRKFFKLFGAEIEITEPDSDKLVGFIEMQAFKLREDIRVYSDKTKSTEVFRIHARNILDFGVTYDVFDSQSDEHIFSMRRKALRSAFLRDKWEIKTPADKDLGKLQETSGGLALVRRYTDLIPFVGPFIDMAMGFFPITYSVYDVDGKTAANLIQQRNPLIVKFILSKTDEKAALDPRVSVALTAMLSIVDASKN